MPRYFFDIVENGRTFRDEEGLELDGPEEACAEAEKALPPMARDLAPPQMEPALDDEPDYAIEIRDEAGHYVARITAPPAGPPEPSDR